MGKKKVRMCKLCREREATVRDRDRPWDKKVYYCPQCHAEMLKDDLLDSTGGETMDELKVFIDAVLDWLG